MDQNTKWHDNTLIERTAKALKDNYFEVSVFATRGEAVIKLLELIGPNDTVGVGGSMTVRDIVLLEELQKRKQTILQHTPAMPQDEALSVRKKAAVADVYIASPNAITTEGTLIFCDGVGNRAAAMIFGPGKIIAVAGVNKIVESEEAGWQRIDSIAAPINAKRLNLSTPCAATGTCSECESPQRICRIGVTLWKKPRLTDYHVILINENLGY
jgi:hypothetical protein